MKKEIDPIIALLKHIKTLKPGDLLTITYREDSKFETLLVKLYSSVAKYRNINIKLKKE